MKQPVNSVITLICICMALLFSGCQIGAGREFASAPTVPMSVHEVWALGSLSNTSNTPGAEDASAALLETHLRRRHLLSDVQPVSAVRYEVEGAVSEWHYIGNVSPQPVIAVRIDIKDLRNQDIVWSQSIRKVGSRRQILSALGDSLLEELVTRIPLDKSAETPDAVSGAVASQLLSIESPTSRTPAVALSSLGLRSASSGNLEQVANTPLPLHGRATAFYYGSEPAVDILSQYDRLVLEPDNIKADELIRLKAEGARTYAYLSVGEVGPFRAYASDVKEQWVLGKNPTWDSQVLDLSNSELRNFLIGRVDVLQAAGYEGLFLDTMDSFNLVAGTEQQRESQRAGLIELIRTIGTRFPQLQIISNRGFEVLDDIAPYVEAVAAESLYASWNNTAQIYTQVPEDDRRWLLSKLDYAKNQLKLDVIAIEYLPPSRRTEALDVAVRIAEHGFVPWVANPELDYLGIGALEAIPRKVLMIYNSTLDSTLQESVVHRLAATPVEYMGYVPEYVDIATEQLPEGVLKGRYAGIVTWTNQQYQVDTFRSWLQKQFDDRVPVVFMGIPPVSFNENMLASMGIQYSNAFNLANASEVFRSDLIKPERSTSERMDSLGLNARSVDPGNTVHMSFQDESSNQVDTVVTGPFGGFALQPGDIENALDDKAYWVVDPIEFFRTALQLPNVPMPDVTTENGKRLWMAHIDGDALPSWAEMPGRRLGAEVIYDEILLPYDLPHTISVVEGEITDLRYADRRNRMYDIARKIFSLDSVEIASHTYSHPFEWAELAEYRKSGKFNLNIPGYEYSPERETAGSIAFINRELAPPGKRTKLMLWSGAAMPNSSDLAVVERIGIANMNGGVTQISYASPSLTLISPMARTVGKYVQVYAPITNENVYTDNWRGPFDEFRRVIETFKLTENPRRFKPIDVYYHFYSGTKIASMRALTRIYDWSVKQDIYPLFGSEYSVKVPDFRKAGVARYLDGTWKLSALGNVRSIRYLDDEKWPDLKSSRGIVGARASHDANYFHTNGADQVLFSTQDKPPLQIHLASSNGQVLRWDNRHDSLTFRIVGKVPVSVELAGAIASTCTLLSNNRLVKGVVSEKKTITFSFNKKDTGNAVLNCAA
ncbi:endo alpha-1,4 polygalactosaminidase [bacterium]|nr:endo alpha-1,4 polygalactosaminidase [bacterium]